MEKSILKRYDEIFFNKERIALMVDEFLSSENALRTKALDAIFCSYIHYRFREFSDVYPMSILLTIDIDSIEIESSDENNFFEEIKYVANELGLNHITQKDERKIRIPLY